jgi:hypothetical protein
MVRGWLLAAASIAGSLGMVAACVKGGVITVLVEPDAEATGGDASGSDALAESAASSSADAACGDAPWVTVGLVIDRFDLAASDAGTPLPGAVFATSLCPGLTRTSDDAGQIVGQISEGVPFTAGLTASNYISELLPEQTFDADSLGNRIEMLPVLFGALLPGFGPSSTAIIVELDQPEADAGPCSTVDGVSYSVPGHPEATISYFSSGSLPSIVSGATATTSAGLAAITGLASGLTVSPAATKSACTVSLKHGSMTGRVAVENGYASLATAVISP